MDYQKTARSSLLKNCKKLKRYRSAFTTEQINYLESEFKKFPYIGIQNRKEIAMKLKIQERAIKIWFQNRRMKEKKDVVHKEFHNYDQMCLNGTNLFNDQLNDVNAQQSNNNLCSNSIVLQTKPITSLYKLGIHKLLKENDKAVSNISTTQRIEKGKNSTDDAVRSPYFQNNTVTSSSNDCNSAELSIELIKRCQNNINSKNAKNAQKNNIVQRAWHSEAESSKLTGNPKMVPRETRTSTLNAKPTVTHQQSKFAQVPSGYVPVYPQNCYRYSCFTEGNFLWKPIDPSDITAAIPLNDFTTRTPAVPYSFPQNINMQMNKCFCNCHMNHLPNPVAFPQQNHMPQAQYLIAIPINTSSAHISPPLKN